ncbi:MAG: serine hydrolase [Pseudomonadota bacterium]
MHLRRLVLVLGLSFAGAVHADALDDVIEAEMKKRQIPGLSIAVIDGGKIVRAKGYGVTEKGGKAPVTPSTLFQAGSISKPVAALGALRLVMQGSLALDDDVNQKLVSWKVPQNAFNAGAKVTLRKLLNHSAGLTVHGFPGYAVDAKMPSVVQILNGAAPANTGPVVNDIAPGSKWRYSGGGYTVVQQLMVDVTGKPFAEYMQKAVLAPLGMHDSSYQQPPAPARAALAASGHYGDRSPVKGRWHIYPEMAAAGLWTNPSDLARFAVGIQNALAGTADPAFSQTMTREMLTDQMGSVGLGLFLKGSGATRQFFHNGRDEGFDALMSAYAETGQGVVIMINANDNSRMSERLTAAVARHYNWPEAAPAAVAAPVEVKVDAATLARYTGRYEIANNVMLALDSDQGRLVTMVDGIPDDHFISVGKASFSSTSSKRESTFELDEHGVVTGLVWKNNGKERKAPRIGPLMQPSPARVDTDPARTGKVKEFVDAAGKGGAQLARLKGITDGKRASMGGQAASELGEVKALAFMAEHSVAGRAIERHGSKIDKVLYYKLDNPGGAPYLMVFLSADGAIADHDVVTN